MAASILGIGIMGLSAAQTGLTTTSHNISNANTPSFSRQSIVQSTANPLFTGGGYMGQGAQVETIRRSYSSFLEAQVREATSQSAHVQALHQQSTNIDNLFADPSTGLTPAMNDFFASVNTLSANPGDSASRQQVLSASETLAGRFRGLADTLQDTRRDINQRIQTSIESINGSAAHVAELNDRIRTALGSGQTPNDLLDQRDAILRDLSSKVRINVVPLADGTVNAFMPNGLGIVLGTQTVALSAQGDPADPANTTIGLQTTAGFKPLRESDLSGGDLGGLLAFRSTVLDSTENALGRVASTLASAFNAQHMVGMDRNGNAGTQFFVAGSGPIVNPNANNTGNAVFGASVSSFNAVSTSDYRVTYTGTGFDVRNLSDNSVQSFATMPQTVGGIALSVASGTPAAGDSFLIQPMRDAARNFTVAIRDTGAIAAGYPMRGQAAAANTSQSTLQLTGVTPPATANLTQPVTLTFTTSGTFDVSGVGTGNPSGVAFSARQAVSYNGWTASFKGAPKAGDVFTIVPNVAGVGDNGNLEQLGAVYSARLLDGASGSILDAYAQMVSRVGVVTNGAGVDVKAYSAVVAQAQAAQQSVSCVNLDEEAANLLKYQQAYQAAGKVIATANSLFEEILSIMR